jgi:hypothetical protein
MLGDKTTPVLFEHHSGEQVCGKGSRLLSFLRLRGSTSRRETPLSVQRPLIVHAGGVTGMDHAPMMQEGAAQSPRLVPPPY